MPKSYKKRKFKTDNKANKIFFAYQSTEKSKNCDNVDAIREAASQLGNAAITWEKMKTNGKLINKEILRQIDQASIFACDLTYQNPNVYFELGYAIGKRKYLFVLLNPTVANAHSNYTQLDILKGIGYTAFTNSSQIISGLSKQLDRNQVLLEQLVASTLIKTDNIDIFYIQSKGSTQAEMDVLEYINGSSYTRICEDPYEISYQPLEWYVRALLESKNIIVHLASNNRIDATMINAKNSFFAGIAYALGKRVLLIAPKPYFAPIDYSDILFEYSSNKECVDRIAAWLPKKRRIKDENVDDKELNLLKLGIGCSIAEDEKDDLLDYFIETQSYKNALKTRNSVFYGRKGTGKTAMYIKLAEVYSNKDNVYVIGLKPESTELIEQIKSYEIISDVASQNSIFQIIWKKVLLSNLLVSIYTKISESNKIEYSPEENAIINYYHENNSLLAKSFLSTVNDILYEKSSTKNLVEDITSLYILPLERAITNYFIKTKYIHIIILADNLDKAWDPKSNLDLQADMILSLMQATGKFQANLVNKRNNEIVTNSILFLRKDIYNFILSKSREPDKITILSHEIEWDSCPTMLKALINKRIVYVLELDDDAKADAIWSEYFDFGREDPFDKVLSVCIPRPRDIIYFLGKMFESACNNSHTSVILQDYQYALNSYMGFLYQNLIAEMNVTYPYIKDFIDAFHMKFNDEIEINQFRKLLGNYEHDSQKSERLINDLFINGYLVGINKSNGEKLISYDEILRIEKSSSHIKRWPFSKKNIFIMQHPRYAKSRH